MSGHQWSATQARSAQVPNVGKRYVVQPALLKLIGPLRGKRVLELGGGSGHWLRVLSERGAVCTGVDRSTAQLAIARATLKQRGRVTMLRGDIAALHSIPIHHHFDIVLIEHVLLELPSFRKLCSVLRGAYQSLKRGGAVIISDVHPFAPSTHPPNIRTPSNFSYFSNGETFDIISRRIDGKITRYRDRHWTLESIVGSITAAGFVITQIIEPRPSVRLAKRHPELGYRRTHPMSFMVKARKL